MEQGFDLSIRVVHPRLCERQCERFRRDAGRFATIRGDTRILLSGYSGAPIRTGKVPTGCLGFHGQQRGECRRGWLRLWHGRERRRRSRYRRRSGGAWPGWGDGPGRFAGGGTGNVATGWC
jgi:hypothetical protein